MAIQFARHAFVTQDVVDTEHGLSIGKMSRFCKGNSRIFVRIFLGTPVGFSHKIESP